MQTGTLFNPEFIGCPVCERKPKSQSCYRVGAHKSLGDDRFEGYGCKHVFTLYDSLKHGASCGTFGLLGVFSNWSWTGIVPISTGRVISVPIGVPNGHTPFSAFIGPSGCPQNSGRYVCPRVLSFSQNELWVSTSATNDAPEDFIGKEKPFTLSVYAYYSCEQPGWKKLFYEALEDYCFHRHTISIFKLATSLELYVDRIFGLFLAQKEVPPELIENTLRSARSWKSRGQRLRLVLPFLVDENDLRIFDCAFGNSYETIRRARNSFAHDLPVPLDYKNSDAAFETAFDLFWVLNKAHLHLSHSK